jgi:uroporphyrinogen III methyltransferase/synthase
VTGHNDPENAESGRLFDWSALARFPGTLVFYMGVTHLEAICRTLIRHGKSDATPAAIIQSGSLPSQRTHASTLADLSKIARDSGLQPPALLVVGEVVSQRDELDWYERLPLFGQRIVVTRPAGEASRSGATLEALGAEVLLAPTVEIQPISDPGPLDAAISRLEAFDWLVFTSANGVRFFLQRLEFLGRDLRALGHIRLAAIGPTTAEALAGYHLRADLVPESFRSEALADALKDRVTGARILLARADRGRTVLRDELEHLADVSQVAVYHNTDVEALPEPVTNRIVEGSVDWITLTSPAIATRLHALLPESARRRVGREVRLASLSPVTSEAAARLGWDVAVEAKQYTWDGLIRSFVERVAMDRGPNADGGHTGSRLPV